MNYQPTCSLPYLDGQACPEPSIHRQLVQTNEGPAYVYWCEYHVPTVTAAI